MCLIQCPALLSVMCNVVFMVFKADTSFPEHFSPLLYVSLIGLFFQPLLTYVSLLLAFFEMSNISRLSVTANLLSIYLLSGSPLPLFSQNCLPFFNTLVHSHQQLHHYLLSFSVTLQCHTLHVFVSLYGIL